MVGRFGQYNAFCAARLHELHLVYARSMYMNRTALLYCAASMVLWWSRHVSETVHVATPATQTETFIVLQLSVPRKLLPICLHVYCHSLLLCVLIPRAFSIAQLGGHGPNAFCSTIDFAGDSVVVYLDFTSDAIAHALGHEDNPSVFALVTQSKTAATVFRQSGHLANLSFNHSHTSSSLN
ncbi:hypothetical protein AC579_705 [Pseudocercospora musae]|uniref:Uncharacterized protein n=1 Tax=Pseudocercospora musae TaxID=113226 RepID=A0A139ICW0_9PEZI|nr:hypothetical protein AC579_705 [Pseudocercospora musae]